MDCDFEIELQEDASSRNVPLRLPQCVQTVGQIAPEDVCVYIRRDVLHRLIDYSRADTTRERGTILLGQHCERFGKRHILLSDCIEAKYAKESAFTLTFTHETWNYVHTELASSHPGLKIIGWQHTHPSYGVFLSSYDLFIQDNFFNLPFQVALVIDPIQNIHGFFQWKNGRIERLKGYCIYDSQETNRDAIGETAKM